MLEGQCSKIKWAYLITCIPFLSLFISTFYHASILRHRFLSSGIMMKSYKLTRNNASALKLNPQQWDFSFPRRLVDVAPWSFVEIYRCFRAGCCFHRQGISVKSSRQFFRDHPAQCPKRHHHNGRCGNQNVTFYNCSILVCYCGLCALPWSVFSDVDLGCTLCENVNILSC